MGDVAPTPSGGQHTMSSREIADLVDARHNDVVETIQRLFAKGVLRDSRKTLRPYTPPSGGRPTSVYDLTKRDTLVVVSGYDDALRARIIDRWIEIEGGAAVSVIPNFADPAAAARAWAEQYEGRVLAERKRAEIGSRREATAMATAAHANRRAKRLEIELGRSREYASIKLMEAQHRGREFDWRLLKRISQEKGLLPVEVFDANYGKVNSYHAEVWRAAYAVEITEGAVS